MPFVPCLPASIDHECNTSLQHVHSRPLNTCSICTFCRSPGKLQPYHKLFDTYMSQTCRLKQRHPTSFTVISIPQECAFVELIHFLHAAVREPKLKLKPASGELKHTALAANAEGLYNP